MAQLTLTEKNTLAQDPDFRSKIMQGLFSKANYHRMQGTPQNLREQKQRNYAPKFLLGGANSIDIYAVTRFWLSNYNTDAPILEANGHPTDNEILNTIPLDVVYDTLAGVVNGDETLPPV